jgi:DNA-binding MarR family transcriptional regulator
MNGKPRRMREPDVDWLGRETFVNLTLLSRRFGDDVEKVCRTEGLTMSHYVVLWVVCLKHQPEGIPMGAVADGHLNRASDVTRLCDRLTAMSHLERFPSTTDRRVVLVRATRAGREVFVRLTRRIKELHRAQWAALDLRELRELHRLLNKVLWGAGSGETRATHPLMSDGA